MEQVLQHDISDEDKFLTELQRIQERCYNECVKLLQLIVELYYDDYTIAIVATFCHCDTQKYGRVTDTDLCAAEGLEPLPIQHIHRILQQLHDDELLARTSTAMKRHRKHQSPSKQYIWYIDAQHLAHSIKYKIVTMLTQLSPEDDTTVPYYHCPNTQCSHHNVQINLYDLIEQHAHTESQMFRCTKCKSFDDTEQLHKPSVLVERNSALVVHTSARAVELRRLCATQLKPLFDQLHLVDTWIEAENDLYDSELYPYNKNKIDER